MAKVLSGPQSPVHTVLLSKALHRFRTELEDDEGVVLDVESVEELLSQAKAFDPQSTHPGRLPSSLARLETILPHISDFAAIVAVCSGADAKATALVWGSLKVLLMLASPATNTMDDIVNMLDELSVTLPRFRAYEENLPMNEHLESALLEVYTEMTCFCARTIHFFRTNPHRPMIRVGWPKVTGDFKQTIKKLKTLSRIVDNEADKIRLRVDGGRNAELIAAMDMLSTAEIRKDKLPCYVLPFKNQERFFGREDMIQSIGESLRHEEGQLKSVVLHGMGGVGKTQTAFRYVNCHKTEYDAIFWMSADNPIKMTQSFLEVSKRLGLSDNDEDSRDTVIAIAKVKNWLTSVNCNWLLVIDNADDPEDLVNAWPSGAVGSVLITSRDSAASFGTSAKSYHITPFNTEESLLAFMNLVGADSSSETERTLAEEIVKAFGGLPLAINQISGFIVQQKLALKDFLPLYERNSNKIDARKLKRSDYAYTLSTVWDLSLRELSRPSSTLQKLLTFFDPDKVHESVLRDGGGHTQENEYAFLSDEMDFLDAKDELLKRALIQRSSENATLTTHRLIQSAVINKLSSEERTKIFNFAIEILSNGFPNTWNKVTSHQFSAWEQCELCLPHVDFLIKQSKRYSVYATDPLAFAELVLRCCWYLYERELYPDARRFMSTALTCLDNRDSLMFANASMLQGLIELDTNNIKTALQAFQKSLAIREVCMDSNDEFIASSLNAISIAYTELGDFKQAVEAGQRAIDIRLHNKSDRIGNSYSNMASTLMRMGEADKAEDMLKKCPSLKDFTDETFLNTGNPRFSGDMVLLARIRQHQGRLDDAIRLSSKALAFRQKLLGSGLKTCDSLYQVATFLQIRGDLSTAINFLEESILIAGNTPEGKGYEARSIFRLSQVYASLGDTLKSKSCADLAATKKDAVYAGRGESPKSDAEDYERLVLWMLW